MWVSISLFCIACGSQANAAAADNENRSKFIEVGTSYEYSDNIYKLSNNEKSGNTALIDLELGYKQQQASNNIALNYYTEYAKDIDNDQPDSSYWIGSSSISQQLFTEKLLFNLAHTRQRYLINESKPKLDENQSERDLLDLGLQWSIPYSSRTTFILGLTHTEAWFNNSNSSDSNTNEGKISWQYTLNEKSNVQLSYFGSENRFDDFDNTYTKQKLDARFSSKYRLGNYSINTGQTWVDGSSPNDTYSGMHYGLTIDTLIRRHLFVLSASREQSNSSQQIGESTELDFSENQLFWRTQISLSHQYTMLDDRLVSNIRLYFNNNDVIETINGTDARDTNKYGAYGQLVWSITEKLSSSLSADYYESELSTGSSKIYSQAEIYARYNIIDSLYIQCSAAFEKQRDIQGSPGYEEQHYTTRIAFRY